MSQPQTDYSTYRFTVSLPIRVDANKNDTLHAANSFDPYFTVVTTSVFHLKRWAVE